MQWDEFVVPVVGVVASMLVGVAYAAWRGFRARRSPAAVRAGRAVTIPVLVGRGDDFASGRAFRDGEDVRIVAPKVQARLRREDFARSTVRRGRLDDEHLEYAVQRGFVDEGGTTYLVGPPEEWEPAFEAMLAAPARPAGRVRPLVAALPRAAVGGMALGLLGLVVFQGVWAMGHDVNAGMARVVEGQDGSSCAVTWVEGSHQGYAEVDCSEPYPSVGTPVRIRALGWPLSGNAMDEEGSFEGITSITAGVALLSLLGGVAVAGRRLRRPVAVLRPQTGGDPRFARTAVATREEVAAMSIRTLAATVAAQEGWVDEATDEPPRVRPWTPALLALGAGRWWPAFLLGGVAWLPDSLPQPWRLALTAGAVVVVVVAAWRALNAWLAMRSATRGPVTSEWDYQLVRSVEDEWLVLLLLGDTPHWMVMLAGDPHPAAAGRCGVRGDLEDGAGIQLQVRGRFWVPASPVLRVPEEFLAELREDLESRLVGDPDVMPSVPPTVRP